MATEVYEDALDLYIDLLEAGLPPPGASLPSLRRTGQSEMRTFRTVVLENGFLKVQLVPALGGRLVSLFDKRTQTEILQRHPALQAVDGGPRGVFVREGIQLVLDGQERPNSLGNVAVQIEHAPDEEAPAGVWIHESGFGPLGFHLRVALLPDRPEVVLEARIANRTLQPTPYAGGLRLYVGDGRLLAPGRWADAKNRPGPRRLPPKKPSSPPKRTPTASGPCGAPRPSCTKAVRPTRSRPGSSPTRASPLCVPSRPMWL